MASMSPQEIYDRAVLQFESEVETYMSASPEDRAKWRKELDRLAADWEAFRPGSGCVNSIAEAICLRSMRDVVTEGERRLAAQDLAEVE